MTASGEPAAPPPLGQGETVLIVHDDRDGLLGDEEILAALGYEPVGFDPPAEAIAAVRSEPARFDAALISVASVGDALDLAHTLHAISRSTCRRSFRGPCVLAATSRKRPRKRKQSFARRNERFRDAGRKSLRSLGRETKAFRGIVSFQQLNLLSASRRRAKAQSRGSR
jgi:hypothetical protein